jgi:uncharacterized RmlC-like cupin family protein
MESQVRLVPREQLAAGTASGAMTRAIAIAAETVGSTAIFTLLSVIPPGLRSSPHVHMDCEASIYVVSGEGRMLTGARLDHALVIRPGDFLFVPPGAPHTAVNDGDVDLVLVVSRNTAEERVEDYVAP